LNHQTFVYFLDGFAVLGKFGQRSADLPGIKIESRPYLLDRFIQKTQISGEEDEKRVNQDGVQGNVHELPDRWGWVV
jgi:hypothetical protein